METKQRHNYTGHYPQAIPPKQNPPQKVRCRPTKRSRTPLTEPPSANPPKKSRISYEKFAETLSKAVVAGTFAKKPPSVDTSPSIFTEEQITFLPDESSEPPKVDGETPEKIPIQVLTGKTPLGSSNSPSEAFSSTPATTLASLKDTDTATSASATAFPNNNNMPWQTVYPRAYDGFYSQAQAPPGYPEGPYMPTGPWNEYPAAHAPPWYPTAPQGQPGPGIVHPNMCAPPGYPNVPNMSPHRERVSSVLDTPPFRAGSVSGMRLTPAASNMHPGAPHGRGEFFDVARAPYVAGNMNFGAPHGHEGFYAPVYAPYDAGDMQPCDPHDQCGFFASVDAPHAANTDSMQSRDPRAQGGFLVPARTVPPSPFMGIANPPVFRQTTHDAAYVPFRPTSRGPTPARMGPPAPAQQGFPAPAQRGPPAPVQYRPHARPAIRAPTDSDDLPPLTDRQYEALVKDGEKLFGEKTMDNDPATHWERPVPWAWQDPTNDESEEMRAFKLEMEGRMSEWERLEAWMDSSETEPPLLGRDK